MTVSENDDELVKVGFRNDDGDVETLWAFPLGNNLYRLDNSPFYIYGVSWQDVVEAQPIRRWFPLFRSRR